MGNKFRHRTGPAKPALFPRPARFSRPSASAAFPLFLLLGIAVLLGGCGFHLRGATELPPGMSPAFVQANPGSAIAGALNEALRSNGIQIAAGAQDAGLVVRIVEEESDNRVLAVNSAGKVIAYEIRYKVGFAASAGGRTLERQTVEQAREYVNPDIEVLGKEQEAALIRQDMLRDVADRILRRLKAQLG